MYWLEFFISAAIIVIAGTRLTVCADEISDEMNLGKVWIGIALLGVVTSLPEAITSLMAVILLKANDLAVGDLVGSNAFNPMLIVVMDIFYRQGSVTSAVKPDESNKISAYFANVLTFLVIVDIMVNGAFPAFHVGPVSVGWVLIAVIYLAGMKRLARLGAGQPAIGAKIEQAACTRPTVKRLWAELAVSTVLVVGGAMWLTKSADAIALETGLGRTFVGSFFLAIVTSLPEMVVSLSAMRLGALDLAIGNIFGSNMANMFILFVCGLFTPSRPILAAVSPTHMLTAALSILLVNIAVKGLLTRNKRTVLGMGWDSIVMTLLFFAGMGFLYSVRHL